MSNEIPLDYSKSINIIALDPCKLSYEKSWKKSRITPEKHRKLWYIEELKSDTVDVQKTN
jgi:hypothetical protein